MPPVHPVAMGESLRMHTSNTAAARTLTLYTELHYMKASISPSRRLRPRGVPALLGAAHQQLSLDTKCSEHFVATPRVLSVMESKIIGAHRRAEEILIN
ncbi:hypothetical protein E2C01_041906 [Portunus trituberculatus]|uniref:Uncharacterized protein n=1 Tax=Portunus trituberculatus TaxID=210409 RepID=A0A5B7FS92_PORTR|nr:hypothetical protein [Portunus trituberculatus]